MKTGLKILHKVPDLDELAEKHQDFDALMDAYTDEKIRKRKKFYKAGSFLLVILATTFFSWLYWGYEPQTEEVAKMQTELPEDTIEKVLPVQIEEPKVKTETTTEVEKEQEAITEKRKPIESKAAEPKNKVTEAENTTEVEGAVKDEIAAPIVTTRQLITADAVPVDGLENLYRYLYKEIILPDTLLTADGTLFLEVEFEVSKEGDIEKISFNKELPIDLRAELEEVFVDMPAWRPALEKGDSITSVINLPITFQKKGGK